jgi:hypothetical protein
MERLDFTGMLLKLCVEGGFIVADDTNRREMKAEENGANRWREILAGNEGGKIWREPKAGEIGGKRWREKKAGKGSGGRRGYKYFISISKANILPHYSLFSTF